MLEDILTACPARGTARGAAAVGQQELAHRDMSSLVVGEIRIRGSEMSVAEVLMPTSVNTFPAHPRSS